MFCNGFFKTSWREAKMGSFKTFWREKKSKSDKSKVVSKRFGRWAALVYVTAPRLLRPKVDSALSASHERVY